MVKNRGLRIVASVISTSCNKIRHHKKGSQKEIDRVTKIFRTVYKHAKKHGQSDKYAFRYCYNVYKEQAPAWALKIVNDSIRENTKMKITERQIRQIIREELNLQEADIIKFRSGSKKQDAPVSPEGRLLTPVFGPPAEPPFEPDEDRARRQDYNTIVRQVRNIIEDELFTGGFSPLYKSNLEKLANMADDMLDIREEDEEDLYDEDDEDFDYEDEDFDYEDVETVPTKQAVPPPTPTAAPPNLFVRDADGTVLTLKPTRFSDKRPDFTKEFVEAGLKVYRETTDKRDKARIKDQLVMYGVDPADLDR